MALAYYNRQLAPRIKQLGATLIAVSPQSADRLREIKDQQQLDFYVASDANRLGRRLGVLYTLDESYEANCSAYIGSISDITGAEHASCLCRPWWCSTATALFVSPRPILTGWFARKPSQLLPPLKR